MKAVMSKEIDDIFLRPFNSKEVEYIFLKGIFLREFNSWLAENDIINLRGEIDRLYRLILEKHCK